MYQVYLLQSINKPDKSYVGLTIKGVNNRLEEHNLGLSQFTETYKPWKLIYYENFYCKTCTEKREQFLKSCLGYRLRKLILENYNKLK